MNLENQNLCKSKLFIIYENQIYVELEGQNPLWIRTRTFVKEVEVLDGLGNIDL